MRYRIVLLSIVLCVNFVGFSQEAESLDDMRSLKEEVWKVVEKRNSTWIENDFDGHMEIYHPEFRRWSLHQKTLLTKDIFSSFWDTIKESEESREIEIERQEMQIFHDGNMAIAHYTIHENFTWIGNDMDGDQGESITKGDKLEGDLRFSDIYIKEGNKWLYVGGHRDGAYLEE